MNAKELLEEIKNNEVQYAIVDDKGAVYCNHETDNIMDIYGFVDEKEGHFYGVWGSHDIGLMANIVAELVDSGMSDAKVMKSLGMDADELLRLKQVSGLASLFADKDFSKSWDIKN